MLRIQRILCPIDFSDFSRHAFDRALAIARSHDATVTALHVVPIALATPMLPYIDPPAWGRSKCHPANARTCSSICVTFSSSTARPETCSHSTQPGCTMPREILAQATRLGADLIVMGTHGRSGVERLMLGSVTEKILRKAKPPVLTVPAAAPADVRTVRAPFARILCALDFSGCAMTAFRYARALAEESDATLAVLHAIELAPPAYDPLIGPPMDLPGFRQACESVGPGAPAQRPSRRLPVRRSTSRRSSSAASPTTRSFGSPMNGAPICVVLGMHGRNVVDRVLFGSAVEPVVRRARIAPC